MNLADYIYIYMYKIIKKQLFMDTFDANYFVF